MNADQAANLTYRIKRLEEALSLRSLYPGHNDIDEIRTRLNRLSALTETGNYSYGGPIRANNGPVMWTIGPFREALDATFDVDFDLWVPDNLLRLLRVQLRLKPVKIRNTTLVAVTPSGVQTSDDGGGQTNLGGGAHSHIIEAFTTLGGGGHQHGGSTATADGSVGDHIHGVATTTTGSHNHDVSGRTTSTSNTHSHSFPDHDHTIPSHGHTLNLGITEGGTASNVRFSIDGIDRTAVLGGPWNAAVVLDITQYLLNVRNEPVAGAHPVKIEASSVGAVEIWFDFYGIAKVPTS